MFGRGSCNEQNAGDGHAYQITLTDPPNTIHGGKRGFDKRVWSVRPQAASGPSVAARLGYASAEGEEGFPGRLQVGVTYSLFDDGSFAIHYVPPPTATRW